MFTPAPQVSARHNAQLIATDLSIIRGGTRILHRVSLTITSNSRVAVVGENGRGKSTLLHAFAGALTPDEGSVHRIGSLGLAEQEMPANDGRTVGDAVADAIAPSVAALADLDRAALALTADADVESDVKSDATSEAVSDPDAAAHAYSAALERAEQLDAWDAERRVQIALDALDAVSDRSRPLAELSVGQRYRVRLACLLGAADDFLLLDEPTNHLDRSGLDFLTAELRRRAGGVVVVTHDRALLADLADTIVDLDPTHDGTVRITGSGYTGYRESRVAERERWEQEYTRQQAEHARLQDRLSAAQNRLESGWRPEKGTNKHGRATRAGGLVQSVHRRQQQLDALAVRVPEPPQRFRFPEVSTRVGGALLEVDAVRAAGRLEDPVSLTLARRGRLLVTGPNGAGKSTLLALAAGALVPDSGRVRRAPSTRLALLAQESVLPLDRSASEVYAAHLARLAGAGSLAGSAAGSAAGSPDVSSAPSLSQLGLLRPTEANQPVGELSMGQQRRLDLALVVAARPHVLLLDEPTNHLSITLVDELTEALGATDAAVVVSTHDRQLLRDTAEWPRLELRLPVPARIP